MIIKKPSFVILLFVALLSCKSTKNQNASPQEILVLLSENLEPENIETLANIEILEKKRTSKSQNQWLLKFSMTEQELKALEVKLEADPDVIDIIKNNDTDNTSSNSKSGKSKPKINN